MAELSNAERAVMLAEFVNATDADVTFAHSFLEVRVQSLVTGVVSVSLHYCVCVFGK